MTSHGRMAIVAAGGWIAAAALAVTLCVWAVRGVPGSGSTSVRGTSALDEEDGSLRRVRLSEVHSVDDLARQLGDLLDRPVYVHAEQIQSAMIQYMEFPLPEVDVRTAFRLLNSQCPNEFKRVSWCVFGDHIEIGEWSSMEELKRVRRVYEIGGLASTLADAMADENGRPLRESMVRKILDILTTSVETRSWRDNGGDLASVEIVGTSLVISAPAPMQREIEAVLEDTRKAAGSGRLVTGAFGRLSSAGYGGGGGQSPGCFGR